MTQWIEQSDQEKDCFQSKCLMANRDPDEVAALIKEYYTFKGNECGGALHVVIDDLNVETEFVCRALVDAVMMKKFDALALGQVLRDMTVYDRCVAIYKFWEKK